MTRRDEILAACNKVVAMPTCVRKAGALMEDQEVDFRHLERIIEHDPGLTANLLKVVNASTLTGGEPVLTARRAMAALHSPDVLRFFVSTGVAPYYVNVIAGYDQAPSMFLQHSTTVAIASRELARALGLDAPEHVYTAGLLSGIGKLLLGAFVQVDLREILRMVFDEGLPFDRAEEAVLGISHAEVGGLLLSRWGLPEPITRVVRHHLRPDAFEGEDLVLDLVHVGNVLAKMIGVGLGADGLNYEVSNNVVKRLGITSAVLDTASANVVVELNSLWDLFLECAGDSCNL
ncbi:MAG: HDOD domain-containing protein [Pseudodesulfovibrio sp.]|uniref:HD-like signal output (HDOD) protein n=1 Tax=Pseudodesulfovibrio indicus TaxID=1716143 RepID=A0A140D9C1_9BACT|nr:HDOD domain-containing protein [Pseudodesulfovibrio indicus]AMK09788.1 histidine kinase [Pseudodesulfovibrio indicus]TDT86250.1 HD-like signal output (HDOD) protein [Pseudodesulfovibrio indicus]